MPAPHHSVFTGRMPFLPPNQQCQSTEGKHALIHYTAIHNYHDNSDTEAIAHAASPANITI